MQMLAELLSPRELQILYLYADGQNCTKIGKDLKITAGTVKIHMRSIRSRLNVHSMAAAVHKFQVCATSAGSDGYNRFLELLLQAKSNKVIEAELGLSPKQVQALVRSALTKAGAKHRGHFIGMWNRLQANQIEETPAPARRAHDEHDL